MRRRAAFLTLDILGLAPVAIHYLLLDFLAAALLCLIYIAMDTVAAIRINVPFARRAYWAFYPAAVAATAIGFTDVRDLTALAGTLFAVASRQQQDFGALKVLVFLSAIAWGVYGWLAPSYSQLIFSIFYAGAGLLGAVDEARRRPPV